MENHESNASRYRAPWGRALKWTSALATTLLIAISAAQVHAPVWLRVLPLALAAGALPFAVCGYEVLDGALVVLRPLWRTRVSLAELKSARFDPDALNGSIRTCGNGGLYSFTGWYWSRRLGRYRMFATDLRRLVVLRFDGRTLVVSPEDPEAFVRSVSRFCGD